MTRLRTLVEQDLLPAVIDFLVLIDIVGLVVLEQTGKRGDDLRPM